MSEYKADCHGIGFGLAQLPTDIGPSRFFDAVRQPDKPTSVVFAAKAAKPNGPRLEETQLDESLRTDRLPSTSKWKIGRLQRMAIRDVWAMEEFDLSPWLAENLDLLSDELDLRLELVEMEHRVGRYELDLLLRSEDDRVVIVENQFGRSDHDHLGKLLAYAAGTNADVVVWLAEDFTEEHLAALQWLN
jgi:hypothetical protein